jgi:hypothetical protein
MANILSINAFAATAILILWSSSIASAATYSSRTVGQLISTFDSGDCIIFTLEGVSEADSRVPGAPWFAIPRTQFGAKDGYAMLLAAKLTGEALEVRTGTEMACGYIKVSHVIMQ